MIYGQLLWKTRECERKWIIAKHVCDENKVNTDPQKTCMIRTEMAQRLREHNVLESEHLYDQNRDGTKTERT